MAVYRLAFEKLINVEGGYVNHPDDPGKETYKGISRRYNPGWDGWQLVDKMKACCINDIDAMLETDQGLQARVQNFYYQRYWTPLGGIRLSSQWIAEELLEIAINIGSGVHRASEWLQRSLNLLNDRGKRWPDIVVDGVIGTTTLKVADIALSKGYEEKLIKTINLLQGYYYIRMTEKYPKKEVFYSGWLRRVEFNKGG